MSERKYKPTESKYKGTAQECYITYDLEQMTRSGETSKYPKVKRVHLAGDVQKWEVGHFKKKSGRSTYGVRLNYEQTRDGYQRKGYTASRNGTTYRVPATTVEPSVSHFSKIVELPEAAENIKFRGDHLPSKYQSALQNVK